MSCSDSDRTGAFPSLGPLTYLHLDVEEARAALVTPYPRLRVWYHATNEDAARSALVQGLLPSCWVGGDCCCVFGYDDREQAPRQRGDWVLEIYSRALPGQLKAWWVLPPAIRGVWLRGEFLPSAELRAESAPRLAPTGSCACELSALTAEQVVAWRGLLPLVTA